MKEHFFSIAIDGPAASGKSTAGKGVSKKLDFVYVDTGAMYRAFTLHMMNLNYDCKDEKLASIALKSFNLDIKKDEKIFLNGDDVTSRIRELDVSSNVSEACKHKEVREKLVEVQRSFSTNYDVVMDGRDIATVVLPHADLKIYQVASVSARAKRRYDEMINKGINVVYDDIVKDIERRDFIDSTRANSPLVKADDAIVLDTSNLTIEEEIDKIVELFCKKTGYQIKNK